MIEIFSLLLWGSHLEDITSSDSGSTSQADSTGETWKDRRDALLDLRCASVEDPWVRMYHRDPYARARVMKATRLLLPFLKPGNTVLDVGCYTQEAKKYLPYDVKYVGVDGESFHKDTVVVDLNGPVTLPPFHYALCLETLEHLLHPSHILQDIVRGLPEEGRLVVSLPNEATIFHRMRSMLGTPDAECFSDKGKHLHLPSLRQAREFLSRFAQIERELYYIAPSGEGSRQAWIGRLLRLVPDCVHQWLADSWPSLFARGWIFQLKTRLSSQSSS